MHRTKCSRLRCKTSMALGFRSKLQVQGVTEAGYELKNKGGWCKVSWHLPNSWKAPGKGGVSRNLRWGGEFRWAVSHHRVDKLPHTHPTVFCLVVFFLY